MEPIAFSSVEQQQCLGNYTSRTNLYPTHDFTIKKIRKLGGKFQLLDWWRSELQRAVGLVLGGWQILCAGCKPELDLEPTRAAESQ